MIQVDPLSEEQFAAYVKAVREDRDASSLTVATLQALWVIHNNLGEEDLPEVREEEVDNIMEQFPTSMKQEKQIQSSTSD